MNSDPRSAAVKLIMYDFSESPYHLFENYWADHIEHYLKVLGPNYYDIEDELEELGYEIK